MIYECSFSHLFHFASEIEADQAQLLELLDLVLKSDRLDLWVVDEPRETAFQIRLVKDRGKRGDRSGNNAPHLMRVKRQGKQVRVAPYWGSYPIVRDRFAPGHSNEHLVWKDLSDFQPEEFAIFLEKIARDSD